MRGLCRLLIVYPAALFAIGSRDVFGSAVSEFPKSVDVVIVGGGIIGLTTALELARAGLKVCVLDRGTPGREASWAGGGMLSPLPPDAPAPEIKALLDESLALYPDYCEELRATTGVDPEYWVCGAKILRPSGERWIPGLAQVRNPRLIRALLLALRQYKVEVVAHVPALHWLQKSGALKGVHTAQGAIGCGAAVLAAGAWSGQMANVAIEPVKGQMLLLRAVPGLLDHIRMDDQAYVIPRRDGQLLVGSTLERAGFDAEPTRSARDSLIESAERLQPGSGKFEVLHQWAGLRPANGEAAPFVGPMDEMTGLFANVGHFRLGITLSLASAQLCSRQILGSPGRKADEQITSVR